MHSPSDTIKTPGHETMRCREPREKDIMTEVKLLDVLSISEFGKSWGSNQKNLQILSVNPNGMKYKKDWEFLEVILNGANSIAVDVICLSETNTDWGFKSVTHDLHRYIKRFATQYRISYSNSPVTFGSPYQPGGTLTMGMGGICGKIKEETSPIPDDGGTQ
jgi:hypothetical protein